jgi:hypothetical protein
MKTHWNGKWVDEKEVSSESDFKWGQSAWLLLIIFMCWLWSQPGATPYARFLYEAFGFLGIVGIATNSFFMKKEKPLRSKIAQQKMMNRNVDLDLPALSSETRISYDLDIRK